MKEHFRRAFMECVYPVFHTLSSLPPFALGNADVENVSFSSSQSKNALVGKYFYAFCWHFRSGFRTSSACAS